MRELLEKRQERFSYLESLYKLVNGSTVQIINHDVVVAGTDLSVQQARDALNYLLYEAQLKAHNHTGDLSITQRGIRAYEEQLLEFSSNIDNSDYAIACHEEFSYVKKAEITEFVSFLKETLPELQLNKTEKFCAASHLKALERELQAEKPLKSRIQAALNNLKGPFTNSIFDLSIRLALEKLRKNNQL